MKINIIYLMMAFTFAGCASHEVSHKVNPETSLPQPPAELAGNNRGDSRLFERDSRTDSRTVASQQEYLQSSYNSYYSGQNFYQRIGKLENLVAQLHSLMPEKGHAKKRLLAKHLMDIRQQKKYLESLSSTSSESSVGWLPAARSGQGNSQHREQYSEKLQALGKIVASYKVMNQMGIYLSQVGLFDGDTRNEDFYLSLLNKSIGDIEGQLSQLPTAYRVETKEAAENTARLEYSHHLANGVRFNLPRALQSNPQAQSRKLDGFFKRVAHAESLSRIKSLLRSEDGRLAQQTLKSLHVTNSGDIQGFEDEVDLTLSTKFGLEMIQQLVASAR
ncbi:hypothetical protein [Pseudobdellovibrio exovorus]|uniref:Lipoprotein n=1 Tax=Pseudobdellovibrio exovorus JSS TaxID=1184267 RepID=M4V8D5_9BACT|nr:hypothetical protein [Pseudobdellovibrio exovorus]AGH94715.1 hypothetical protein A11Q_495 [Pseudobdellovibrio exovorus JSS]